MIYKAFCVAFIIFYALLTLGALAGIKDGSVETKVSFFAAFSTLCFLVVILKILNTFM